MAKSGSLYGLAAEFHTAAQLLEATRASRSQGYRRMDAYSPLPVEGLTEALGLRPTRLPQLVLAGGVAGALLGFGLQYYLTVVDYPLNVGGRPLNSWPAFMPVSFELGILFAALTAFVGMLVRNRQLEFYHPIFNAPSFQYGSQDRFFLCIEAGDPRFDPEAIRRFLLEAGATEVFEVER